MARHAIAFLVAAACSGGTISSPERSGSSLVHAHDVEPARFAVITEGVKDGTGMTVSMRGVLQGQPGESIEVGFAALGDGTWHSDDSPPVIARNQIEFELSVTSDAAWRCKTGYCEDSFALVMTNAGTESHTVLWYISAHVDVASDASLETGHVTVFHY